MGNNCNINSKPCSFNGCSFPVFAKKFCVAHQRKRTDAEWLKKISNRSIATANKRFAKLNKPIAKNSVKRAAINSKQYEPRARAFREEKKICEVCPVLREHGIKTQCSGNAEAVHHMKGKATIELLLNVEFWKASCFWGNGWIEENSATAFHLGLKVPDYNSKLSKFKT